MKILVVHQYYLFPGKPGGSRFNEMCRLWAAMGHDVAVVAGTIDYATGETPERYRRRWVVREKDGPVTVYRCHVPPTYRRSYAGRMWAFFGFTLSALTAVFRAPRAEVVIATSPPLVAVFPAWAAARLRRAKWVFEIRDLWPESAITTGVISRGGALARLLFAIERWACRSADKINVLTPAFRDDLVRRGLAPAEKIVFIPNGADVELFQPAPRDNAVRRELGWGERFVVLYAGAHGRANAVGQLIDAAELLRDRADILIATVGDGPELPSLREAAARRGLANIVFYGAKAKEQMPDFVNACDAGAAVLQNNPTFRTVYPNKVFDYMACARPTLLAIDGVARALVVDEAKAGVFVEPENAASIAAGIRTLADDADLRARLGRNGLEWVRANATRDALAARYAEALKALVS